LTTTDRHLPIASLGAPFTSFAICITLLLTIPFLTTGTAQTFPADWTVVDVGAPEIPGYATSQSTTVTVSGAGNGIGARSDQFTFAYRVLTGDGTIVARVASLENATSSAKVGIMIREALGPRARNAFAFVSRSGVGVQRGLGGETTTSTSPTGGAAPLWLKLERRGSTIVTSTSADGTVWTTIATDDVPMLGVVYAGLAVTSATSVAAARATFTNVAVTSLPESGKPLPAGWQSSDIGSPVQQGVAAFDSGTFGLAGGGRNIGNAADQFHYTYRRADGDLEIVARVRAIGDANVWSRAGVMIRESLTSNGAHASLFVSSRRGVVFQRRPIPGASSVSTLGTSNRAPVWLKLTVHGSTISAYESLDRTSWRLVGTDTLTLPSPYYVGLAVTSLDDAAQVTTNIDNVQISSASVAPADDPSEPILTERMLMSERAATGPASAAASTGDDVVTAAAAPAPWTSADVGSPTLAGSTDYANGTFSIRASGADIWDPSDQFHFAYQQVTGDVDIIARVASLDQTWWSKAGVMVRGSLAGNAMHASMFASGSHGMAFQRRPTAGGTSVHTAGWSSSAPVWVKLTRRGTTVTASQSLNGTTWSQVGTQTLSLPTSFYVGLAVTSHDTSRHVTATFDNVVVLAPGSNQPPSVSLTAPANGATFTAPATMTVSATASDTDGTVARVDFYSGATLIGSDTTSPYSINWSNVPAGSYSLTARATDNAGAVTTSAARGVTVTAPANQPPSVSLTAPANGATFTAPATITMTATASDTDGTIARVDFFQGTTQIGSDTTSPYSVTWSNVPAGSYSLTARATDNAGASTTSAARSVTVTATGLPAGWTAADVGSPSLVGQTTHTTGTFSVTAGGTDIWGTADQFHFAYQQVTGDVDVVARVATLGPTNPWSKAGVMVRASLAGNAAHASMFASVSNGLAFQRRTTTGGMSVHTPGWTNGVPVWVKLSRRGSTVTASQSLDGTTWSQVGVETLTLPASFYVGLAVTSHDAARTVTATFDGVLVQPIAGGNQPPTVSLTAPANGATFTAPATITVSATASDTDGTIARVDFYQGATLIGSDTTSPYSISWNSVPAGSYSLTARATDNAGATTTSAARSITVNAPNNQPPSASLTAPANGATFTAPATIAVSANASDSDGTIARVDFYQGTTLIGSDSTSPYSISWSNVPAGTYSLTARAVDDDASTTTSAARTVTVNPPASQRTSVFNPSPDHNTLVSSYLLEIFPPGANTATATPIASQNFGKPPIVNGEITADATSTINALAPGNYQATVAAVGTGGSSRSAPTTFTR
jgi:regulation of enolase protein 1 (concanavalin A-like superfamily)/sulfur relay (sulfurtransferase) complex TusBCD TusD component (DsrE family)